MKRIFTLITLITGLALGSATTQTTYGIYSFTGTSTSCASRVGTVTTNNLGADGTFSTFADGPGAACSGSVGADRWTTVGVNAATANDAITNDD